MSSRAIAARRSSPNARRSAATRFRDAMHGFVEDHRALLAAQPLEAFGSRAFAPRQESFEHEMIRRQTGSGERRDGGAWTRHGNHVDACCLRGAHEPPTGIADQRCAGIAHERHGLASLELLEEACNALGLVMLVVSNKSLIYADSR